VTLEKTSLALTAHEVNDADIATMLLETGQGLGGRGGPVGRRREHDRWSEETAGGGLQTHFLRNGRAESDMGTSLRSPPSSS
jgi:hypothetical protein